MPGKYRLTTFGCKVNQYESQILREIVESCGWARAERTDLPDLVIVNSCAVTEAAMFENDRAVRRAARAGASILVVGCGASAAPWRFHGVDNVKAVLGHDADLRLEIPRCLAELEESSRPVFNRGSIPGYTLPAGGPVSAAANARLRSDAGGQRFGAPASTARLPSGRIIPLLSEPVKIRTVQTSQILDRIDSFDGHRRAFVKVQDGCDAFCTYCIIPQLRSAIRWKPIPTAVTEVRSLVKAGYKEIVLTGIFLGAYGRETAIRRRSRPEVTTLAGLVRAVAGVDGLERLRLSSLEPGDLNDELMETLVTNKSCAPHLHLPIQSGSEKILRNMNRQYTRDELVKTIQRVRAAFDRPAITTDIIVGFPGEEGCDFEDSIELARFAEVCKIHAFPFSPRSGTAADRWKSKFVPTPVVQERMQRMAQVDSEVSFEFRKKLLGIRERLIVENKASPKPEGRPDGLKTSSDFPSASMVMGRADRYCEVWIENQKGIRPGDILQVTIDRVTPDNTHATLGRHSFTPLPVLFAGSRRPTSKLCIAG